MVFESSLSPQAAQLADSLNVRPAPSVEKTPDEQGQDSKTPEQNGDMITISKEARALIAAEATGNGTEEDGSFEQTAEEKRQAEELEWAIQGAITDAAQRDEKRAASDAGEQPKDSVTLNSSASEEMSSKDEARLKQLNDQIEKLREEIKALEESDLPEKEKTKQLLEKQAHLMELLKAKEYLSGPEYFGGTPANEPTPSREPFSYGLGFKP